MMNIKQRLAGWYQWRSFTTRIAIARLRDRFANRHSHIRDESGNTKPKKFKTRMLVTGLALLTAAQYSLAKPNLTVVQEKEQQDVVQTIDKKVEQEEKKPLVEFGYNGLENALVHDAASKEFGLRSRLLTDFKFNIAPIYIGYWGLNELTNLKLDSYFGRNVLYIAPQGSDITAAVVLKLDKSGIFDAKYGARYIMGGGGFVDAGINPKTKSANIACYYALPLGKGWMIEFLSDNDFAKGAKPAFYSEIQVDKELAAKLSAFFRIELNNAKIKEGKYLVGIAKVL